MKTREDILKALQSMKPNLATQYHVRSLALFGSYSRGDNTGDSDVDILVDLEQPISGLAFVNLADDGYFGVSLPTIWQVVLVDLPELYEKLKKL